MFTFKKMPRETGLRAIANPYPETTIKNNRVIVGRISPPSVHNGNKWKISLMVKEKATENCSWGWLNFKKGFDNESDARVWLNKQDLSSFTLHNKKDD